jgi:hypothetical protein
MGGMLAVVKEHNVYPYASHGLISADDLAANQTVGCHGHNLLRLYKPLLPTFTTLYRRAYQLNPANKRDMGWLVLGSG